MVSGIDVKQFFLHFKGKQGTLRQIESMKKIHKLCIGERVGRCMPMVYTCIPKGYIRRELAQHDFCLGWLEQI